MHRAYDITGSDCAVMCDLVQVRMLTSCTYTRSNGQHSHLPTHPSARVITVDQRKDQLPGDSGGLNAQPSSRRGRRMWRDVSSVVVVVVCRRHHGGRGKPPSQGDGNLGIKREERKHAAEGRIDVQAAHVQSERTFGVMRMVLLYCAAPVFYC